MKIVVTGGAGYIGSVVVEQLIAAGESVVVLDNLSQGHRAAVHPAAVFVKADLSDRAAIDAALSEHRPDAIMHFASRTWLSDPRRSHAFCGAEVTDADSAGPESGSSAARGTRTVGTRSWDALLPAPALSLSTAFFADGRGDVLALQASLDVRARIARERLPTSAVQSMKWFYETRRNRVHADYHRKVHAPPSCSGRNQSGRDSLDR